MKIVYKPWATGIADTDTGTYKAVPDDVELDDVQKIIKKQNSLEVLDGSTWYIFNNIQAEVKSIEMTQDERDKVEDSSIV